MLELESVQKSYKGFSLNCSLAVQEGGITGLIGANGAGKSTTFKAILGLIHTEGGKIRIFGREVKGSDKAVLGEIGVVLSGEHIARQSYGKTDGGNYGAGVPGISNGIFCGAVQPLFGSSGQKAEGVFYRYEGEDQDPFGSQPSGAASHS